MTLQGRRDVEAGRGDQVAQTGASIKVRVIRVKHFEGATGDELAAIVRAWFVATTDTIFVDGVQTTIQLNEEREIIEQTYQIAPDGTHHVLLLFTQ